jgi:integrase
VTIYKPKNSRHYHYDFQFKGIRYHGSTGCQAKRDAERYERDKRTEVALGVKTKPSITWDEACGLYWAQRGKFERDTSVRGQIARLNDSIGAKRLLADLTFLDFSNHVARRRAQKARNKQTLVTAATVNREITLARRIVRLAATTYAAPEIEWTKLLLREPKERVRELSGDEEVRLMEALGPDLGAVVEFAILSGQRRSAIITMIWSKVDLQTGWAEVLTKGDKWHRFPLTPRMVAIIANQPKVCAQVFTYECERPAPPKQGHPPRVKGERYPFSRDGWRRKWAAALKAAGVTDFRFHDLRHTAGSRVTRGSNIKVAQKLLGHTRIETTSRYAHVHEEDIRAAMESAQQSRIIPEAGTVVSLKPAGNRQK